MIFNKILSKIAFPFTIVILQLLIPNGILGDELECQKAMKPFFPDPFEYHSISDEEAFELHFSEDEYDRSIVGAYTPIGEDDLPRTGSIVTFCNEADCNSVAVVFGGLTHPGYLSCLDNILFYNIPSGTYAWSSTGCGRVSTGFLYVDGVNSYTIRICPSPTQECCSTGCLSNGFYGCWQCAMPRRVAPPTITTTIIKATTTIPETTTSTPTTTTQPVPGIFSISGHITGDVISDISIQLKGSDSRTLITDENGHYEFSDLENGYYTITPQNEGCDFEPRNYVVQNLANNLSYMDFVATRVQQNLPCPSEVIYGEESEETKLLRYFRDNVLSKTPEGREYIKLYYQWSPVIIETMEKDEVFKSEMKQIVDGIMPAIRRVVE